MKKRPSSKQRKHKQPDQTQFVVGIGASAGGLEALRAFFSVLGPVRRMSFIVVQHLAPQHRSRLVELIAHSTTLKVEEVQEGQVPQSGVIYITPPNKDVFSIEGILRLKSPHFKVGPKPSIDLFLQSLAEDKKEYAIGIILSGTGTDGAHGVRAIKAEGGLSICQTLATAKYDGMPKAAKLTSLVDLELAPEEIAQELMKIDKSSGKFKLSKNSPGRLSPQRGGTSPKRADKASKLQEELSSGGRIFHDPYFEVLELLKQERGANFSQYKPTTIRRRMERRVLATRSKTLDHYVEYLTGNPEEARLLFQDILISVTSFLRDPESFRALQHRIVEKLKAKPPGSAFRVWIAGCATGEEAYTVAIILAETIPQLKKNIRAQIFATDIDEHALSIARRGLYSGAALKDLPKALRTRYFTSTEEGFQIQSYLRDQVIFAKQNVTSDPPFLNLDLVSCRNVLIYFNSKLQEKVFQTFHYSMNPNGILFLGRSEAIPTAIGLFALEDKQSKIFSRVDRKGEVPFDLPRREVSREAALSSKERKHNGNQLIDLFTSLVDTLFPDSALLDENFHVKHLFGNAGAYLSYPPGEVTHSILKIVTSERSIELSSLLRRAQKTGKLQEGKRFDDHAKTYKVFVIPLISSGRRQFLVAFQTHTAATESTTRTSNSTPTSGFKKVKSKTDYELEVSPFRQLEHELVSTREQLQTVVEEQEASTEEFQSMNEELQSANEELETTNEELQSTNEELTTLNQELNVKTSELQAINHRLQAVQSVMAYPLLILDRRKNLVGFNPAARSLLRLTEQDLKTHIRALPSPIEWEVVIKAIENGMKTCIDHQFQFRVKDRSFEVQIQILRGAKDTAEGAVVSFVDNSEIIQALENTSLMRDRLSMIFENTPGVVKMKDLSGVYTYVNRKFCEVLGKTPEEIVGKTDVELFGETLGRPLRAHDLEVMKSQDSQVFFEEFSINEKLRVWMASKFPLFDSKKRVQSTCAIAFDVTERIEHERQLDLFTTALSAATSGIIIFAWNEKNGYQATYVSDSVNNTLEASSAQLLNLSPKDLFQSVPLDLDRESLRSFIDKMVSDSASSYTLKLKRSDAEIRTTIAETEQGNSSPSLREKWIEIRSCQVNLINSGQKHLIITLFEATHQVQSQQIISAQQDELVKYSRLSALGEISAGIAHEINTPLNVITTKADLLKTATVKKRLDDRIALMIANDISEMVRNISGIVLGLKSIAGLDPERFERANLNQIVRDTAKICEFRLHRFGVSLQMNLPADEEAVIFCCRVQIIQILINLINNSIDAISQLNEQRWIKVFVQPNTEQINITITDCGLGIEPGVAERIMTPFFTTKSAQKGTGIGLSLSRAIARHHGGDLVLDQSHQNTSFQLTLPKRGPLSNSSTESSQAQISQIQDLPTIQE